ncbi:MAG: 50S ribosomal protein L22 [Candidatus Diapherotrites archaeon]|nr:50S ribosomal protein L22 [Candidatus Diapherotrites archaeon]
MVKKTYQQDINGKKIAKAMVKNKPVSTKFATELCREIKGKKLTKAEEFVKKILDGKEYLPLRKYRRKVAHRKGKAKSKVKSGRYPKKLCRVMLELMQNLKANAENKGLDPDNLMIVHAFASTGFRRFAAQPKGRIAGKIYRKKSTHIELIARELRA